MKLMTKSIEKQAQKQYKLGSNLSQMVVAKFFNPSGSWCWYLMNQDPEDPDYLWGIIKGNDIEMGSFSLSELKNYRGAFYCGIERDRFFKPTTAKKIWGDLLSGKDI